ncbi:hypothetical protein Mapa_018580 [Marchantia paleacea]|nr:hypothetical protein Mapa_018580 [Marchantia paleacea]
MGSTDVLGGCLRQAQVFDLPLVDKLLHLSHGDFDRDLGVHSVLVVQVDAVHAQSLEAGLACSSHVLGVSSGGHEVPVHDGVAEFGGQLDLVSDPFDGFADQDLVRVRPIDVRSVEECDSPVHCLANELDHLLVRSQRPVEGRHSHAPQPLS